MAVDANLVSLASQVVGAAAVVEATSAPPERAFFYSPDGWVCFGNAAQASGAVVGSRGLPKLYASPDAPSDVAALNAIMATSLKATAAENTAAAQEKYDDAAAAWFAAVNVSAGK